MPSTEVLYGIRVNGEFVCMDLDGNFLWTSGKKRPTSTSVPTSMSAQGLIYALDGHGRLDLLKVDHTKYVKLASHKVFTTKTRGGPMALAGGRLIARDVKKMICIDVSKGQ